MPEKPPETKGEINRPKHKRKAVDSGLWDAYTQDIARLKLRQKVSKNDPDSSLPLSPAVLSPKKRKFTPLPAEHGLSAALIDQNPPRQVDKRTRERFERGDMPIDGKIDLHGMTEGRAHSALSCFLGDHISAGSRCLLVITGQGRNSKTGVSEGILNKNLPLWVMTPQFAPFVLSVTHAQRKHGGKGAYYILLRRKRNGD